MSMVLAAAVGLGAILGLVLARAQWWITLGIVAGSLVSGGALFFATGGGGLFYVVIVLLLCLPAFGGLVAGAVLGLFSLRWFKKA